MWPVHIFFIIKMRKTRACLNTVVDTIERARLNYGREKMTDNLHSLKGKWEHGTQNPDGNPGQDRMGDTPMESQQGREEQAGYRRHVK